MDGESGLAAGMVATLAGAVAAKPHRPWRGSRRWPGLLATIEAGGLPVGSDRRCER